MQIDNKRLEAAIKEMDKDMGLPKEGPPREATCVQCKGHFTAYFDTAILCSRACKDAYFDKPRSRKVVKQKNEKPLTFTITNRFLGGEKVCSRQETLDWIIKQGELNNSESREFMKTFVVTLIPYQGVDVGDYCIVRIC